MSKTAIRKLCVYCLTLAGGAVAYNTLMRLDSEGRIVGGIILGVFCAFFWLPFLVFGATVDPRESAIRVQQYVEAELPYSQVRACCGWIFPPFYVVALITKKRFPLCCLISIEGTMNQGADLEHRIKKKIKELSSTR